MSSSGINSHLLPALESFFQTHQIPYVTPSSPGYVSLRATYIISPIPIVPLCISRPRTADEVALIVQHAVSTGTPFTIRSGGLDLFGRCFRHGALAIDLRELNSVQVARECRSAVIGGGVLAARVAEELGRVGLTTAMGSMPSVGYVGWATHGGYGQFSAHFGLGVDQILGARVVNHEGRIVEADAGMLEAIRGAGGTVGVVVEMTIRVFPLENVLGGIIAFSSADMSATVKRFTAGYTAMIKEGVDLALGIQQSIVNTPNGRVFAVGFVWSSDDLTLGLHYLEKITSLGDVIMNKVAHLSVAEWMAVSASVVPATAYGITVAASVRCITEEVIDTICREVTKMPQDPSTLLSIHQLRDGPSLSGAALPSVFGAKMPHFVIELIGTSSTAEATPATQTWALACRNALHRTEASNVLEATYISLTPPGEADYTKVFGSNWKRLVELKALYDPHNVFKNAMPQFPSSLLEKEVS